MQLVFAFTPVLLSSMMLYLASAHAQSSSRLWLGAMAVWHLYLVGGGTLHLAYGWYGGDLDGLSEVAAIAAIVYSVVVSTVALVMVANRPVAGRMRALLVGYGVGVIPVFCTLFLLMDSGRTV